MKSQLPLFGQPENDVTESDRKTPKLIHADCLDAMRAMEANSIDAIVTDPPYGLAFMGKGWDHGVPGVPFWTEALRVAKPGAHLVAFGGTRTYHRLAVAIEDAGWEIRDCLSWLYGSGFPKSLNVGSGRGTALKPAWEPIILARKPLVGTVAANVLAHGTGAINVDACRIGLADGEVVHAPQSDPSKRAGEVGKDLGFTGNDPEAFRKAQRESIERTNTLGRWPANVALDEEAAAMLDEQTGTLTSGKASTAGHRRKASMGASTGAALEGNADGSLRSNEDAGVLYGDSGGASRFFYTAKASRRERGEGNTHPTVKPLALMRWLVKLVTPPGGVVLDPFAGSGTTLLAAQAEGFDAVGIEREAEYVEIARKRIEGAGE